MNDPEERTRFQILTKFPKSFPYKDLNDLTDDEYIYVIMQNHVENGVTKCKCGEYIRIDWLYCRVCGLGQQTDLTTCDKQIHSDGYTRVCNAEININDKYCHGCGGRIKAFTQKEIEVEMEEMRNMPPPSQEEIEYYRKLDKKQKGEKLPDWCRDVK